jgi:Uma2 family endonuclease
VTFPAHRGSTEAEYLALERASDSKHEFVAGTIVAMAGARPPHNMLAANMTAALSLLCRSKGCVVMTSDQRIHVPATRLYAYPDVTVACGERRYHDDDPPSLLSPTLLVEVTSDSTEEHDRGTKFLHYQAIASLREYIVVSHRTRRVDHHRRLDSGQWLLTTYSGEDADIALPALGGSVTLAELYHKVDLAEGAAPRREPVG